MDVDIKISGLDEVEKQLKKLEAATAVKALNSALMSAAKPTYDRARANAAFSENFKSAIRRKKHRTISKKKGIRQQKGFRRAFRGTNRVTGVSVEVVHRKAPHFHLVELGTTDRYNRRGAYRGKVQARSMLGKAFSGNASNEAITIFGKRIKSRLKRIAKKGTL